MSEYEFITNYTPTDIPALSSIQVPVLMRVRQTPLMAQQLSLSEEERIAEFLRIDGPGVQRSGLSCKLYTGTRWYYYCNLTTGLWERGSRSTPIKGRACIYDPIEPGPPGLDGNGTDDDPCPWCPDGPIGGGLNPNGWPVVVERKSCKDCLEALGEALDELGVPGGEDLPEMINCAAEKYANGASALQSIKECATNKVDDDTLDDLAHATTDGSLQSDEDAEDEALELVTGKIPGWDKAQKYGKAWKAAFVCASTSSAPAAQGIVAAGHRTNSGVYGSLATEMAAADSGLRAIQELAQYQYKQIVLYDGWDDIFPMLEQYISDSLPIPLSVRSAVNAAVNGTAMPVPFLNLFYSRWEQTLTAHDAGVFVPDSIYPIMLDSTIVNPYLRSIAYAADLATDRGYSSIGDMYRRLSTRCETWSTSNPTPSAPPSLSNSARP